MERRAGPPELRSEGRVLVGPAMRYGDVSPSHRERFEPGAFALDSRTRWLDVRHDRERVIAWTGAGLVLEDRADALMVRAELPAIPAADKALADVALGRLNGFSVEFNALSERREGGLRVIERADLAGVGLVGAPSYQQSTVEIRARSGRTFRAGIPSNRNLACRCSGAGCRWARFTEDALRAMWRETWEEFEREAVAAFGSFDAPLASVSSRTLRGRMRGADLEVEIDIPEGAAGAATLAAQDAAGVIVRPYIDAEGAESTLVGDVREYTRAPVRGFLVSATDQRDGWPAVEVIPTPDLQRAARPRRRRTTLW